MFHFLSGYTAKLAGTEVGVTEPQTTFSTCFGSPFLPQKPNVYAEMLGERLDKTGAVAYLVNTGWTGGQYGIGSRMPIKATRTLVRAAINGELDSAETRQDPDLRPARAGERAGRGPEAARPHPDLAGPRGV